MLLCAVAAVLALATPTASPGPRPRSAALPTITKVRVATGSRQSLHSLPLPASALDRAAVQSSSSYTTDGLLRNLPGFDRTRSNSLFTNYGQLRVSFAGAGNDRGVVLVNGIPAQDGFGGQVDWAAYPASDVQRAELLLGGGSALYGAGAIGGVLDIQTLQPGTTSSAPSGSINLSAGNNAYSQNWANIVGAIAPHLRASVALQDERLQYFALPPAYASRIDRIAQADTAMAAMRVRYAPSRTDVIDVGYRAAWDDQFEGRPNYTFSRRFNQTAIRYRHSTPQSTLRSALYSRTTFVANFADEFPSRPGLLRYAQYVPTNESGALVRWITGSQRSTLELTADARHVGGLSRQYGSDSTLQRSGGGLQNLMGFAVQDTWRPAHFQFVGGARVDSIRSYGEQLVSAFNGERALTALRARSDQAISPRFAARYDLSPHLSLRASLGGSVRAPFLNELVRGYFIGNTSFEPNPLLVPERSHTTSAGLDLVTAKSRLSFDAFGTVVNDAIMFRTLDATHQLRSNIARTQTQAYMVTYTQKLRPCSRLTGWLTAQNARVAAGPARVVGKRLQYVPALSASVNYIGRIGNVRAGASVSYLGQTYADDLNRQPLGTAILVGARLDIPLDGGTIDVRTDNLTGVRYLSSIDRYGPPMLISIGISVPLGGYHNNADACSR